MITIGFEIALGIFLFIVVLIVLVYGLTALAGAVVLLWAWASEKSSWVKLIVVMAVIYTFIGILIMLGIIGR